MTKAISMKNPKNSPVIHEGIPGIEAVYGVKDLWKGRL